MPLPAIDHVYRTLYAELSQRTLDAAFTSEFSPDGRFITMESRSRRYWYFDTPDADGKKRRYVGPVDDPEVTRRVEHFRELKEDRRARRKIVSTLIREAYLPRPEKKSGDVVEALARAGFFRLRGVLVGTVAYQCFSAQLGVRLPGAAMQTGDADFAQFQAISAAIGDTLPPILDVLKEVDPTFREVPHPADPTRSTTFAARDGYKVEFLTPNAGSDDVTGHPAQMPALGHTWAEPLRFLDYLIHEPERAVLLHGPGVPVLVPTPERYAIHKLIVATRRHTDGLGSAKSAKDRLQAATLIEAAIQTRRLEDLAEAFIEAWDRGRAWKEAMQKSLKTYDRQIAEAMAAGIVQGIKSLGVDHERYEILARDN